MSRRFLICASTGFVALIGIAYAQDGGDAAVGKKMFNDTGEDLDYPSCSMCHATVSAKDELEKTGHIKPAYPVFNTAHRGGWKNKSGKKALKSAGDAGNICVRAFQKRKKLPAEQVAHLTAYLASVSPSKDVKPRKILYGPKVLTKFDGGDGEKGKKAVTAYCGGCHGDSDDHLQFELKAKKWKRKKVAMKVRGWIKDSKSKSGVKFKANNGMMGFFAKDRLSDETLLDILAYVGK